MIQIIYYLGLIFFSIIIGLLGIFYRNILKMPNMVFAPIYRLFEKMVKHGGFLKFIAYPLGYCIYCSTTWIAILGFIIVYKKVAIDILIPIAISHYVVVYFCKHYASQPGFAMHLKRPEPTDAELQKALEMTDAEFREFTNHMDKIK